ncbi:MAG TPA: hypothetical protein ENK52_02675 [Saprospiraceae bacterium]|nr:hypothetical protein [Saprospiraceae bacterium]
MKFLSLSFFLCACAFYLMTCNCNKTSVKVLAKEDANTISPLEDSTSISSNISSNSDENEVSKKLDSTESNTSNSASSDFIFSNKSKGCGSFELYKLSLDKKAGLYVTGDSKKLGLSKEYKSFEITKNNLYISIHKFDGKATSFYCDDVADDDPKVLNMWKAVSGKIFAKITQGSINAQSNEMTYRMTLKIESATLKDAKNEIIELKDIIFEEVLVGWIPG